MGPINHLPGSRGAPRAMKTTTRQERKARRERTLGVSVGLLLLAGSGLWARLAAADDVLPGFDMGTVIWAPTANPNNTARTRQTPGGGTMIRPDDERTTNEMASVAVTPDNKAGM